MGEKPLVSVIVPCYNGEKVMHRLLDSLLNQTYKNLEIILVNDGSKDNSEKIWKRYEKKFDSLGMKHKYVYQKNQGLSAAINSGLKIFTGDYLCWPDIDDYLEGTSIEKRVAFLEDHLEYGSVSSDANEFLEKDLNKPIGRVAEWMKYINEEWQFKYLLQGQSIYCSGCHMLRTRCFLDVNPDRNIYPARRGQNNQMLLPIYYKYKHGFIDEPLYNYIIYKKSMSSPDITEEKALDRHKEYLTLLQETLKTIRLDESMKKFCDKELKRIEWDRFSDIYIRYGQIIKFLKLYLKLKIYRTEQKQEIKRIIRLIKNKIER